MARYVLLLSWTDQGVKAYKETVNRASAARSSFERHGGRVLDCYWTLGNYDLVITAEAPDDETITAISIGLGALGNVKTTTLRAFNEDEMRKIIQKV